jgi:Fe-S cluster assembly protein SufD
MESPHSLYGDAFRQVQHTLPGSQLPWLRTLRTRAMEKFMDQGFPDTRLEEWKYTDLRGLARHHFRAASPAARTIDVAALQGWPLTDQAAHRLVFVDGHFVPELSPPVTAIHGVTITSLASALASEPHTLESWLGRNTDTAVPGFNAFNTAFMSDGACIQLAPYIELEQPVHLLFIASGRPDTLATLRNLVIAGRGSRATILESYIALRDAPYLTNTVTEIITGEAAGIEHYKLEQESESAYHMAGIYVRQQRDSRFTSHNVALGGKLARNDLQVSLEGTGADCTLNGLHLTRGRQHVDNHTRIDHLSPQANSREWYRGVLDGRSRTVFNGRIVVHRDAQKTTAQQGNHNLLLSEDAEADAKPQLEIHADDVQCAHGCTVGQLDEEAVFYLRSRALDEATARAFLIYAFAADVLERIRIEPVRQYLEEQLTRRLQGQRFTGPAGNPGSDT